MRFTFIPPQMQSQVTPTSLSQLQAAGVCKVGRGRPLAAAGPSGREAAQRRPQERGSPGTCDPAV